jgi:hypothetical protein
MIESKRNKGENILHPPPSGGGQKAGGALPSSERVIIVFSHYSNFHARMYQSLFMYNSQRSSSLGP